MRFALILPLFPCEHPNNAPQDRITLGMFFAG